MKLSGNRCLCSGCSRYFNSVGAFSKHRKAGVCRDPASIGMCLNAAGFWITRPLETKPAYLAGTKRGKRAISEKAGLGIGEGDRSLKGAYEG